MTTLEMLHTFSKPELLNLIDGLRSRQSDPLVGPIYTECVAQLKRLNRRRK